MGLGRFGSINLQKLLPSGLKIQTDILTRRDLSESGLQKFRWIGRKLDPAEIQVFGGPGPGFRQTGFWGPFGAHFIRGPFGAHFIWDPFYLGPIWGLFGADFYLFGAHLGSAWAEGGFIDLRGGYCLQLQVNWHHMQACCYLFPLLCSCLLYTSDAADE